MRITKMHGIGNDYVYIDGFEERVDDPPALARRVADRHFGVGGDGLIIIRPPSGDAAHCRMEMYNADGSRAEMCGNGIRCVGKFVGDRGLVEGDEIRVETDDGLKTLQVSRRDGTITHVTVDMGAPRLAQKDIPASLTPDADAEVIDAPLSIEGFGTFAVTLVSMGNPHCVVRLDERSPIDAELSEVDLPLLGPLFERHAAFPERINTEFVSVASSSELDFRVWERGSGETLACGTGACAAVVAGVHAGWCDREAVVHLVGGDLRIRYDEASGHVFMTGEAAEVFTAELSDEFLRAGS